MRWLVFAMAVMAATPAVAQTAQQFDLECTKKVTGSGVRETNTRHYRLDLESKRWCMDECAVARDIQSVGAETITLLETNQAARDNKAYHYIYRGSGKYLQYSENLAIGYIIQTTGECKPTPFTGLPKAKF